MAVNNREKENQQLIFAILFDKIFGSPFNIRNYISVKN
jgi:hypothetical protein